MSGELNSIFSNLIMSRKQAASEAYHYVKSVLGEPDENDYLQATVLEDLFDCKVCVMSVAQMYLKGIILPREERIFGMEDVLEEELELIRERILHKEKRIPPKRLGKAIARNVGAVDIEKEYDARIIDVRDEESFCRDHILGAKQYLSKVENIPLEEIIINPHILGDDKYAPILFVCAKGIKSSKAAAVAVKAGYRKIFYGRL